MKLDFEFIGNALGEYGQDIIAGDDLDFLIMPDNEASLLMTDGARIGAYNTFVTEDTGLEFEDEYITAVNLEESRYLQINNLGGFGAVGAVRSKGDTNGFYYHKLLIYEYQTDVSRYLDKGKIRRTISNPISTFDISLENARVYGRNLIGEDQYTHLKFQPGAKLIIKFGLGPSSKVKLGEYYIDKTDFDLKQSTISANGRNILGKVFRDQTFDETMNFLFGNTTEHLKYILTKLGGLPKRKVDVEQIDRTNSILFKRETNLLAGIHEILKVIGDWKIDENDLGKVVIGNKNYGGFNTKRTFSFERDKDIFSRKISRDDGQTYRRVCVKDKNETYAVYKDVETYEGWHIKARRTLYVEMPTGLSKEKATEYAENLAILLKKSGKLETFETRLMPQLEPGDSAIIRGKNNAEMLGVITDVTHTFGKNGCTTTFSVDSGGSLTRGRVSDYINDIKQKEEAIYSDIAPTPEPEEPNPGEGNNMEG